MQLRIARNGATGLEMTIQKLCTPSGGVTESDDTEMGLADSAKGPGDGAKRPGDAGKGPGDAAKWPGDAAKWPDDVANGSGDLVKKPGDEAMALGGRTRRRAAVEAAAVKPRFDDAENASWL